jgi:hypothetical protein
VRALHIRAASLYLLEPCQNLLHLAAAIGLSAAYRERYTVEVVQSPIDQEVIQLKQPVTITEMMQTTGFQYPEEAQRESIRAIL